MITIVSPLNPCVSSPFGSLFSLNHSSGQVGLSVFGRVCTMSRGGWGNYLFLIYPSIPNSFRPLLKIKSPHFSLLYEDVYASFSFFFPSSCLFPLLLFLLFLYSVCRSRTKRKKKALIICITNLNPGQVCAWTKPIAKILQFLHGS